MINWHRIIVLTVIIVVTVFLARYVSHIKNTPPSSIVYGFTVDTIKLRETLKGRKKNEDFLYGHDSSGTSNGCYGGGHYDQT